MGFARRSGMSSEVRPSSTRPVFFLFMPRTPRRPVWSLACAKPWERDIRDPVPRSTPRPESASTPRVRQAGGRRSPRRRSPATIPEVPKTMQRRILHRLMRRSEPCQIQSKNAHSLATIENTTLSRKLSCRRRRSARSAPSCVAPMRAIAARERRLRLSVLNSRRLRDWTAKARRRQQPSVERKAASPLGGARRGRPS
jgi:hypothetical protein